MNPDTNIVPLLTEMFKGKSDGVSHLTKDEFVSIIETSYPSYASHFSGIELVNAVRGALLLANVVSTPIRFMRDGKQVRGYKFIDTHDHVSPLPPILTGPSDFVFTY